MEMIIGDYKVIAKRWMKNGMDRVYINGYPDDVKIWIEADDMYGIRVSAKKGEIFNHSMSQILGDFLDDLHKYVKIEFNKNYAEFAAKVGE